jgi:hypothetical protein
MVDNWHYDKLRLSDGQRPRNLLGQLSSKDRGVA